MKSFTLLNLFIHLSIIHAFVCCVPAAAGPEDGEDDQDQEQETLDQYQLPRRVARVLKYRKIYMINNFKGQIT